MDLQTIIRNRLLDQAKQKFDKDRKEQIEQLKQSGRELLAQAAICQWIEQVYNISLDPRQIAVSEKRFGDLKQGHYSLRIDLSQDGWIACNRDMIVSFGDDDAHIEAYVGDAPDQGLFGSAWIGRDRRRSDAFHDLVEAAIFATGATRPPKVEENASDVYEEIP